MKSMGQIFMIIIACNIASVSLSDLSYRPIYGRNFHSLIDETLHRSRLLCKGLAILDIQKLPQIRNRFADRCVVCF